MTIRAITIDYLTEEVLSNDWVRIVDLQDFIRKQFDYYSQKNIKIEIKILKIP